MHLVGGTRYKRRNSMPMTKNTHMFVQNHNAPVKHWDTGNTVSKQSCQNTIISGWWTFLRWDALYNDDKHTAAINSMKQCRESTKSSILNLLNTSPALKPLCDFYTHNLLQNVSNDLLPRTQKLFVCEGERRLALSGSYAN